METLSASLALCAGNSAVVVEFPAQIQWRGALKSSLICTWIYGCVNNREAGDSIRHRPHYDDTIYIYVPALYRYHPRLNKLCISTRNVFAGWSGYGKQRSIINMSLRTRWHKACVSCTKAMIDHQHISPLGWIFRIICTKQRINKNSI